MQFIWNLWRMSRAMSRRGLHSSPSTECLHMWAPDQLPPASLTLLPIASTILMPWVESGKLTYSAWKSALSAMKSTSWFLSLFMKFLSPQRLELLPISIYCSQ